MVYSVFYYASEAIVRLTATLIITLAEKLRSLTKREAEKEEERKRIPAPAPRGIFYETVTPMGVKHYVWVGRATDLIVTIPAPFEVPIRRAVPGKPPVRLYFTFNEAASKDWFKEIEWLAQQAEKIEKEGE